MKKSKENLLVMLIIAILVGPGLGMFFIKTSASKNTDVNVVITEGPLTTVLLGKTTDNGIEFQYESQPNEYWVVESPLGKKTVGVVINKDELFTGFPYVRFYNKNFRKDVCQFAKVDLRQEEIVLAKE